MDPVDVDEDEDDDIKIERPEPETPLKLLKKDFVAPIERMISNFHDYMAMIEQVVDLPRVQYHEYRISKDFDSLLDKLERKMQKIKKEMEQVRREVAQDLVPCVHVTISTSFNAGLDDVRRREAPLP